MWNKIPGITKLKIFVNRTLPYLYVYTWYQPLTRDKTIGPYHMDQVAVFHMNGCPHTLQEKLCYTPIWGKKFDMDRHFVLPMGWNWHEMYCECSPTCMWRHVAQCYCWSCGLTSCCYQPHRLEACCHWKFGARQIHWGSSEDHTSSRLCFIRDDLTGLLHKCPGLDSTDEEFVWNEGWPENHQQTALVPWFPRFWTHKEVSVDCQPSLSPLGVGTKVQDLTLTHWQHVVFGDESRFQLYLVDGRLTVRHKPGERFQQRCQAYRVQAVGGLVDFSGAFHNGAKSPLVLSYRYLTGEPYWAIFVKHYSPNCQAEFGG